MPRLSQWPAHADETPASGRSPARGLATTNRAVLGATAGGTVGSFHGMMNERSCCFDSSNPGRPLDPWLLHSSKRDSCLPKKPAANFTNVFIAVQKNHA